MPSKSKTISELPLASLSKRVLVSILWYENDGCAPPRFDREAKVNTELSHCVS